MLLLTFVQFFKLVQSFITKTQQSAGTQLFFLIMKVREYVFLDPLHECLRDIKLHWYYCTQCPAHTTGTVSVLKSNVIAVRTVCKVMVGNSAMSFNLLSRCRLTTSNYTRSFFCSLDTNSVPQWLTHHKRWPVKLTEVNLQIYNTLCRPREKKMTSSSVSSGPRSSKLLSFNKCWISPWSGCSIINFKVSWM